MTYFFILLAIIVIGILLKDNDYFFMLPIIGGVFMLFWVFIVSIIHVNAISEIAQIQQLRKQVLELGKDARTEDILGKVADVNMILASCKRMNQVVTLDIFYPDKLCEVEEIKIPEGK